MRKAVHHEESAPAEMAFPLRNDRMGKTEGTSRLFVTRIATPRIRERCMRAKEGRCGTCARVSWSLGKRLHIR